MQQRAVRTRQHLLEAASVIFDRYGYEAANIADILAEGDVTKGALYFHFGSKDELARAVIDAQTSLVQVEERAIRLQSVIDLTFSVATKLQHDSLMRAGIRLTIEQGTWKTSQQDPYLGWITMVEAPLRHAEANHELLPHIRTRPLAELIVASFTGTQLLSEVLNHRVDLHQRLEHLWLTLLPGIADPAVINDLKAGSA